MFLMVLIGFYKPDYFATEQMQFVSNLKELIKDKSFAELALLIILNNIRAAFIGIILGIFFGILPVLAAAVNGYLLGAIMKGTWQTAGSQTLLMVIPHGAFEIPSLCIAFGLGIKFGQWYSAEHTWEYIKKTFNDSMLVFFYIIVPMLVVAGLIEASLIIFN